MARKPSQKWAFKPGMRAGAFGWRGSAKAIQRLKSASAEIRSMNRADPVLAAEGVVALAERIWPAFAHIDTSSGALGTAVNRTLEALTPVLIDAPADEAHGRYGWTGYAGPFRTTGWITSLRSRIASARLPSIRG